MDELLRDLIRRHTYGGGYLRRITQLAIRARQIQSVPPDIWREAIDMDLFGIDEIREIYLSSMASNVPSYGVVYAMSCLRNEGLVASGDYSHIRHADERQASIMRDLSPDNIMDYLVWASRHGYSYVRDLDSRAQSLIMELLISEAFIDSIEES
jgi:hypothetical protein